MSAGHDQRNHGQSVQRGVGEQRRVQVRFDVVNGNERLAGGERDPFGGREEVATYKLSRAIRIHWLTDGDHSFKPRKSSGVTEAQNLETAIAEIDSFVQHLPKRR